MKIKTTAAADDGMCKVVATMTMHKDMVQDFMHKLEALVESMSHSAMSIKDIVKLIVGDVEKANKAEPSPAAKDIVKLAKKGSIRLAARRLEQEESLLKTSKAWYAASKRLWALDFWVFDAISTLIDGTDEDDGTERHRVSSTAIPTWTRTSFAR